MNPIRTLRVKRGLTQMGLASRSGLGVNTIARLDRADRTELLRTSLGTFVRLGMGLELPAVDVVAMVTGGFSE